MIKIEIHTVFGKLIFTHESENNTMKETVEKAVKEKVDLSYANLSYANLSYANLSDANLSYANLSDANLSYANLSDANLSDANLLRANLLRANAYGVEKHLRSFRADFWEILLNTRNEVDGLRQSLVDGNVDGSTYTGDCCCLVGTIANVKGCKYDSLINVVPDSSRPAEQWFAQIKKGDTPESSEIVKLTIAWIDQFDALVNPKPIQKEVIA
jgi:hypothetical protein